MENIHNKTVLEQTYQAQREQQIPDLWSRIEQGFDEEVKRVKSKRRNQYTKYFVLAAAVVLAIVIAVPVFMRNSGLKKDDAFGYGTKKEYIQDKQQDISDDTDVHYSNSEKEEAVGAGAESDAGIMFAEECDDESVEMESTEAGVDSENMDDSAEDITYLFSGQRTKCNGTYDDIQCFALQEIGKDGENGRYIYVDMDSEFAEVAKKLLIQYSVLDWTSSEEECVGENSYLFGFELKDGTVYTIRFLENEAFDSQTCLKFAQVMFRIKK